MSKVCQVTGRKPAVGMTYTIRGIAKKKKGIGLKIVGKDSRRFLPNVRKKRIWIPEENRFVTMKLTPAALRTMDKKGVGAVVHEMRAQGQKI